MQKPTIRVLVFSASLRRESLNTKLAGLVARRAGERGAKVDVATMREFECPSYDGDVEKESGIAPGAHELHRRLVASDAFVIVSPEYNASMSGVLKNAIDWTSRIPPHPFHPPPSF